MHAITGLLKISTLSVALLASTAIVATVAMPDVAYAGNGNGNSGGNGGGNSGNSDASSDNGKSANSKAASAKSKRDQKTNTRKTSGNPLKALGDIFKKKSDAPKVKRVAKTKRVTKTATALAVTTAPKPRGNPLARTLGVHPSELGALNAANASPNALANASPNSRVGKLAIYAEEVEATRTIEAELIEAQAVLDTMDAPEHSSEQIDLAIADAESAKLTRLDELDGLIAKLEEADGSDAVIKSDIETATADIIALDDQVAALEQERADGEAFEAAKEEVATLEEGMATQTDTQRAALEAAANKEVTDEVEAAVQSLLGIYQEPTLEDDVLLEEEILEENVVALD